MNLKINQIYYGLINYTFTLNICKNNWMIVIFLTYNEGKSVVSERFIKSLKGKTCKRSQEVVVVIESRSIDKKHIHADYSAL